MINRYVCGLCFCCQNLKMSPLSHFAKKAYSTLLTNIIIQCQDVKHKRYLWMSQMAVNSIEEENMMDSLFSFTHNTIMALPHSKLHKGGGVHKICSCTQSRLPNSLTTRLSRWILYTLCPCLTILILISRSCRSNQIQRQSHPP